MVWQSSAESEMHLASPPRSLMASLCPVLFFFCCKTLLAVRLQNGRCSAERQYFVSSPCVALRKDVWFSLSYLCCNESFSIAIENALQKLFRKVKLKLIICTKSRNPTMLCWITLKGTPCLESLSWIVSHIQSVSKCELGAKMWDLGLRTSNALANKSLLFPGVFGTEAGKMCVHNNGCSSLNLSYSSSFLPMLN